MNKEKHLPLFGIGPVYGIFIVFITIIGIILTVFGPLNSGEIEKLKIPFIIIGILFIMLGISMWISAVIISKIDINIMHNKLCTTGIYAFVRNPLYSAFMFACTGVLFIMNNLWLLVLPFVYWFVMTILIKKTEEKWLQKLYGQEYIDYYKKVNRCIPWFSKNV